MRKKIVINLDAPEGGPPAPRGRTAGGKRRLWPKVVAILMGLILTALVAIAAVGFFWWRHYQSTPDYTLTLIMDAAQRNDLAELEKQMDYEEIAKNMVAPVSQKAAGRYGFALSSTIQQRIDGLMPSLLPRLKQTIHDEVVKELKELASKAKPRLFIFFVDAVPSSVKVTTEGDTAKATTAINDRTIEMTMRRDAERWKVIEFKDDLVVQRVVDSVMKELPAIGGSDSYGPLFKKSAGGKGKRPRRGR